MAAVDLSGFIADFKDHAAEHRFHIHDERHFVETYTMRQAFEVDLHPEDHCGGPLDVHASLEVEPRVLLAFEDSLLDFDEESEPSDEFQLPFHVNWALPPLTDGPDLLVLAAELAGTAGPDLPLQVSETQSYAPFGEGPETRLTLVATVELSLARLFMGEDQLCDTLERTREVCEYLLDRAPLWLGESLA